MILVESKYCNGFWRWVKPVDDLRHGDKADVLAEGRDGRAAEHAAGHGEIKPSQAREPEISFSVMSRPRPPVQTAEVSPMVSAAETRNTSVTEMIAPRSNFGVKAKSFGRAMIPSSETVSFMDVKSTMPKNRDAI